MGANLGGWRPTIDDADCTNSVLAAGFNITLVNGSPREAGTAIASLYGGTIPPVSPDGSTITLASGGSLTTIDGKWTFGTASNAFGRAILRNGTSAASGYGVLLEVAESGKMFTKNSLGQWFKWTGSAWQLSSDPTPLSPDGSTITSTSGGSLSTADGKWTFGTASNSFGRAILRNGIGAGSGYGVLLEVAQSGKMFTKNAYGGWYKWTGSAWLLSTDPTPAM